MKYSAGPRSPLLFGVGAILSCILAGPTWAQVTFNLDITQGQVYLFDQPDRIAFGYTVTRTGSVPPGATESPTGKNAVLTAILPLGTTFHQATAPPGVTCSSDCAGTVTCNLGSINGSALNSPVSVVVTANRNGLPGPLRSASGVMSIEPEQYLEDNSASASADPSASFSIRTKNATERCGNEGTKIRICYPPGVAPPETITSVSVCGFAASSISRTSTEVTAILGPRLTAAPHPPLTGDITVNDQVVASNAFTYVLRGDANGNGSITAADSFYLTLFIFLGGLPPPSNCSGDANGNGSTTAADSFFLNLAIFLGGTWPGESGAEPIACNAPRPSDGQLKVAAPAIADSIALGQATGRRGGRVTIPLSIVDAPGTFLDTDGPTPLSAFAFHLSYPPKVFTGASVELVGACAGLPLIRDFFGQRENQFAYYAHFNQNEKRVPLASGGKGEGTECARITLDISPTAPKGPVTLRLDPSKSLLSSFDGSVSEEVANGHLRLENGLVTIQ